MNFMKNIHITIANLHTLEDDIKLATVITAASNFGH